MSRHTKGSMKREVDNGQDILDGRDVIRRQEELVDERQALLDAIEAAEEAIKNEEDCGEQEREEHTEELQEARTALDEWDGENGDELNALKDFVDEGNDEWRHGETLIRGSYFEDYARE